MKQITLFLLIFGFCTINICANIVIYPGPKGIKPSPDYKVNILQDQDELSSFVYYSTALDNDADNANHIRNEIIGGINKHPELMAHYNDGKMLTDSVSQSCSFTTFSFSGEVVIKVSADNPIKTYKILPSNLKIRGRIEGQHLIFHLKHPQKIAVVINNDYLNPLFVFADALEQGVPDKMALGTYVVHEGDNISSIKENIKEASVVWFEPGIHNIGIGFEVYSNQTIYVAGGAYLRGTISGLMASNVTIRGRGILSGDGISRQYIRDLKNDRKKNNWKRLHYHAINMLSEENRLSWNTFADYPSSGCDNLSIEGITIASPRQFFIRATGVPIQIYNVKMVGSWPYNTDGISIIGQANTTVFDCFFHCNDDGIYIAPNNCHIHNCNFWQGNNGCVFQFGWGSAPVAQGGGFIHDCNVLHVGHVAEANNRMVIGSRKSGYGDIGDVYFKNIYIEGPVWSFLRLETNGGGDLGSIHDILFENIDITGPVLHPSRIESSRGKEPDESSLSWIRGITFKNVTISGQPITKDDITIGKFQVENIRIE